MDIYTPYQYNEEGGLIDPPTIPTMERQIIEANALGDTVLIQVVTEEYEQKRQRIAEIHNENVRRRADEDRQLLADREERRRAQAQEDAANAAEAQRRRELEALRRESEAPSAPVPPPTAPPLSAGFPEGGQPVGRDNPPAVGAQPPSVTPDNPSGGVNVPPPFNRPAGGEQT